MRKLLFLLLLGGTFVALSAQTLTAPLAFAAVTPCRVMDTRAGEGKSGAFGPPALVAGSARSVPVLQSGCGIPPDAQAYSLNLTVVPRGGLAFLTVWASGQARPLASTTNSFRGKVVASAAVVPAGISGAIDLYASGNTDVLIDINGYFTTSAEALPFYAISPCRVMDTRAGEGKTGAFGPPFFGAGTSRDLPVVQSGCGIPSTARGYLLNMTVVPRGPLSYISIWPAGQSRPLVSVLNSFDGRVAANAALVSAGTNGAISVFATDASDLIIDISGYFAP